MGATTTLAGQCHCGAIRGTLHATKPAAELQVRACQCGFCTRHGAMTVSDPAGRAVFEIERAALTTYRFGTRTGTSLLCARCGMYAGVMLEDGGKVWSVLNVRGLAIPELAGRVGRARRLRWRDAGCPHRPPQAEMDADGDRLVGGRLG